MLFSKEIMLLMGLIIENEYLRTTYSAAEAADHILVRIYTYKYKRFSRRIVLVII